MATTLRRHCCRRLPQLGAVNVPAPKSWLEDRAACTFFSFLATQAAEALGDGPFFASVGWLVKPRAGNVVRQSLLFDISPVKVMRIFIPRTVTQIAHELR